MSEQYIDSIMHGATIKVHGNPSNRSRADACGRRDRQTDTKLIAAFRDCATVLIKAKNMRDFVKIGSLTLILYVSV